MAITYSYVTRKISNADKVTIFQEREKGIAWNDIARTVQHRYSEVLKWGSEMVKAGFTSESYAALVSGFDRRESLSAMLMRYRGQGAYVITEKNSYFNEIKRSAWLSLAERLSREMSMSISNAEKELREYYKGKPISEDVADWIDENIEYIPTPVF
jgi:hypothetical protein